MILVNEVLDSCKRKSGKEGWMVIKIDLEKAYDRLEWSFITHTLSAFNFPLDIVELIMHCVSSTSMSIIHNTSLFETFYSTRGIRHDDPFHHISSSFALKSLLVSLTRPRRGALGTLLR